MKHILITGGAGFIGVNSALYFADKGWRITVLDNLSRRGSKDNLNLLQERTNVRFKHVDIRDKALLEFAVKSARPDVLLHLAGQVAVTTSVSNPREDFEINALGTFNALESVRQYSPKTFVINASTNKIYGKMENVGVAEHNSRFKYEHLANGVAETQPLEFLSPYGCSKGAGDQYTIDYSRIFGLKTVTLRQSCIYGTRQYGMEDQGWVAWFIIAAVLGKPITIYGDGKQTRDILHVEDLCRAYEAAIEAQSIADGQAFNIGGGPSNAISLQELIIYLEEMLSIKIPLSWSNCRPGDQSIFVCDINKARKQLGWHPTIPVQSGLETLVNWVRDNKKLFSGPA